MRQLFYLLFFIPSLLGSPIRARAQGPTGQTVRGTVLDAAAKAPLIGARRVTPNSEVE